MSLWRSLDRSIARSQSQMRGRYLLTVQWMAFYKSIYIADYATNAKYGCYYSMLTALDWTELHWTSSITHRLTYLLECLCLNPLNKVSSIYMWPSSYLYISVYTFIKIHDHIKEAACIVHQQKEEEGSYWSQMRVLQSVSQSVGDWIREIHRHRSKSNLHY